METGSIDDFSIIGQEQQIPQRRPLITDTQIDTSKEDFEALFQQRLEEEAKNPRAEGNATVKEIRPAIDLSDY